MKSVIHDRTTGRLPVVLVLYTSADEDPPLAPVFGQRQNCRVLESAAYRSLSWHCKQSVECSVAVDANTMATSCTTSTLATLRKSYLLVLAG